MVAVLLCGLGLVQLGSDALYGSAASPSAFPAHVPPSFGLAVYRALDRAVPAPYVEATLARAALARHDLDGAQRAAIKMPASPVRNELLAQIAQARGQQMLALEYYFAAPDVDAMQAQIAALAARDPSAAYALESRLRARLVELRTHPDAVAESYWIAGEIAAHAGWSARALADYATAAAQAPLNAKYALATANQALTMRRHGDAERWYAAALNVDPQNPDATAGLGIVALRHGDRAAARRYEARARRIDPHALLLAELERELR